MGNYLQPISSWAKTILEERETNKLMSLYRTPFVVMSSAAFVAKLDSKKGKEGSEERQKQINDIITNPPTKSYKGCIISNNVNSLELSYSPNQTIVGVDFDGNHIVVEGETGRKVSTPIILSVDVDTEEANNTIKTTRIGVKCFSLKQLEMFEMFFMKPGMSVMVEWGDSSLLKRGIFKPNPETLTYEDWDIGGTKRSVKIYSDITQALFIKQNQKWDDYCQNFSNVFVPSTKYLRKILKNIANSLGSYDFAAGKISDYSYTIAEDGTYDVTLTIFQMNQVSLALPVKGALPKTTKSSSTKSVRSGGKKQKQPKQPNQPETEPFTDALIVKKIIMDFGLPYNEETRIGHYINGNKSLFIEKGHFFNFTKINREQKDTSLSTEAYLSLEFILNYIVNNAIPEDDKDFRFQLPTYTKIDGTGKPIGDTKYVIPVHLDEHLISSNEDIIFPNKELIQFALDNEQKPKEIKIKTDKKGVNQKINGSIKGKTMLLDGIYRLLDGPTVCQTDNKSGNALNCFISYKRVLQAWSKSVTKVQFIRDILEIVNNNSYGLMNLVLQPVLDGMPISVVCSRYAPGIIKDNPPPYRFKPTTINSTVKNFTYTFQMDNLIFGKTMHNSQAKLRQAFEEKRNPKKKDGATDDTKQKENQQLINKNALPFPADSYRTFEYGMYGNADGYFSINNVEKKAQETLWKEYQAKSDAGVSSTGEYEGVTTKTAEQKQTEYANILNANSKKFKTDNTNVVTLIYKDKSFIQSKINITNKPEVKSLLTNISVSITIDGFSGLRAGEVFHIDGIPEIYNQTGAFQIRNIKHNITPEDGWNTTIEGDWRIGVYNDK